MSNEEPFGVTVWPYNETIKIAKLHDDAILPSRKHVQDAGLDFFALTSTFVKSNHMRVVRTGITIEIPWTYFGLVKPKSGGDFIIGGGVIDAGYQGEILVKVYNYKETNVIIRAGDPLGQLVLIPIIHPEIKVVDVEDIHVKETDRGETGGIVDNGDEA
ncbi:hypothetical protein LCGC14_0593250 [marine sediment metagenome]|uniref:dUTP diphosphatase n=1 Tax=marine sediment metagenome TaxID=412755 RepID=A0A0F9RWN1_9ZZZZ